MTKNPLIVIAMALASLAVVVVAHAQMGSRSQGKGAWIPPGASAGPPKLSGATQEPLSLDLSGVSFTGNSAVTFPAATGGSVLGGMVSYVSLTPSVCSVNGTTVTPVLGGQDCTIQATLAGSGIYGPVTTSTTIAVPLLAQDPLVMAIPALAYPGSVTLPAATGGSGTKVFTYTATGACSLSGSTLTANSAGACTVTVSNPANSLYASASLPVSINISASNMTNPCSAGQSICNLTASTGNNTTVLSGVTTATFTFKADPNVVTKACLSVTNGGRPLGAAVAVSSNATQTITGVIGDGTALSGTNIKVVTNGACNNYPASGFAANSTVAGGWGAGVFIANNVSLVNSTVNVTSARSCNGTKRTYALTASASNTSSTTSPSPTLAVSPASANCTLTGSTLTINGNNSCSVLATSGPASATRTLAADLNVSNQISMNSWMYPTDGRTVNADTLNAACSSNVAGSYWSGNLSDVSNCSATNNCLIWRNNQIQGYNGGNVNSDYSYVLSSSSWWNNGVVLACSKPIYSCTP